MTIRFHKGDISKAALKLYKDRAAVDTETMGLNPHRDRLCLVQLSPGDGSADIVQMDGSAPLELRDNAPNLVSLLENENILKIFHYARFDVAVLARYLGVGTAPIFCTKIASRLARTYTDKHGLKDLVREVLGIEISKTQQSSDWGAEKLTQAQLEYAASDVLHLHALMDALEARLEREDRLEIAEQCFDFLPTRAMLDLMGWAEEDIFAHS